MGALANKKARALAPSSGDYAAFRQLDGQHPFKLAVPGAYVDYQVRTRRGGEIAYLNFDLAREMGLLPARHPDALTPSLRAAVLEAFALQIINEYDVIHGRRFAPEDVRPHRYMATRYLQLQHPDRRGTTSGDGRSIWNGTVTHRGATWDVSSCGTGATCLSPATAQLKRFIRTGDPEVAYGCGHADLDTGLTAAIFSEILHRSGVATERTLAVISFPGGRAIIVRAGKNLLRPSHFFTHLRQGNYQGLMATVSYFAARQAQNGDAELAQLAPRDLVRTVTSQLAETFARSAARFESEYLFVWMDWDGDNILADGGIIDYGSVRQFGLFHHEYRYDDTDRFSTSILEQRAKARGLVQAFAQMRDYLLTGTRRSLDGFARDPLVASFDRTFEAERRRLLLLKVGLSPAVVDVLASRKRDLVERFRKLHAGFERAKSRRGPHRVADGTTWDAIYCLRDLLRELPRFLLQEGRRPTPREMLAMMASSFARGGDLKLTPNKTRNISAYLVVYDELVAAAAASLGVSRDAVLRQVVARSAVLNCEGRMTGNAAILVGKKLARARKRLGAEALQELVAAFVAHQSQVPRAAASLAIEGPAAPVGRSLLRLVAVYRDTI